LITNKLLISMGTKILVSWVELLF